MDSGRVTFFSRSRQRLWAKGEVSGHYLALVAIEADCDSDTLLVQARPAGPTCHLGTQSCFRRRAGRRACRSRSPGCQSRTGAPRRQLHHAAVRSRRAGDRAEGRRGRRRDCIGGRGAGRCGTARRIGGPAVPPGRIAARAGAFPATGERGAGGTPASLSRAVPDAGLGDRHRMPHAVTAVVLCPVQRFVGDAQHFFRRHRPVRRHRVYADADAQADGLLAACARGCAGCVTAVLRPPATPVAHRVQAGPRRIPRRRTVPPVRRIAPALR